MSAKCQTPLNQLRHSNVAVVKYTKHGKRLELACYKNKVGAYRSGVETRLDEVLQIDRVFSNVARGAFASTSDIHTVLGKEFNEKSALEFLLMHGDVQVAQQERSTETVDTMKDVCTIISQKCVNPVTMRPYPPEVIERTLRSMGVTIRSESPKKQALQFIHQLISEQVIPIKRADMKLKCCGPWDDLKDIISSLGATVVPEETPQPDTIVVLLESSKFRDLDEAVKDAGGTIHVLETAVMQTGEGDVREITETAQSPNAIMSVQFPKETGATKKDTVKKVEVEKSAEPAPKSKKGKSKISSLDAELSLAKEEDSDDGGKKGKKKREKKKKAAPAPKKAEAPKEDTDSDEELSGNRKNRKKKSAKIEQTPVDDEFEDDEDWS